MSVIFSKALNSTLGKSDAKGFDELLAEQFNRIEDTIKEIVNKQIQSKQTPAFLLADKDFVYDVFDVTTGTEGKKITMPCDGNIFVNIAHKYTFTTEPDSFYVEVYKNGEKISSYGRIQFKKGDELHFVGKFRGINDVLRDGITFAVQINAKESLGGLKIV